MAAILILGDANDVMSFNNLSIRTDILAKRFKSLFKCFKTFCKIKDEKTIVIVFRDTHRDTTKL